MKLFFLFSILFISTSLTNTVFARLQNKKTAKENPVDQLILSYEQNPSLADSLIPLMKLKLDSERPDRIAYLRHLGTYYYLNEIPDSALKYYKLGIIAARQSGDKYYDAYFRLWSGIILNIKSEYSDGLDYLIKAQELALQTDSSHLLSVIYRNTGNIYWGMGKYEKALDNYFKSLRICETNGYSREVASVKNNIGNIYKAINDDSRAIEYYHKAYELSKKNNYKRIAAITSNNIGDIFLSQGNFDSAINYFNESLEILENVGSKLIKGITLFNIAEIYIKSDSTALARHYLNESLKNASIAGDKLGVANCYLKIGESYLLDQLPAKSEDFIDSGMIVAKQIGSFQLLEYANKLKTDYYTQIKDFPAAYETMQIRIALKDSLFSQESGERIAKLENRITEEQRLNEIENLRKIRIDTRRLFMVIFTALVIILVIIFVSLRSSRNKNKILSEQFREISNQRVQLELKNEELIRSQADLSKINEDKNSFMTIISHDLKNPLSAIRGFLELLITRFEVISDADKKKFLQEVFDSVEKISLLLNNILFWGKSQTSGFQIKNEDFEIYKRIKDNLSLYQIIARSKNITLTNHIPKDIFIHADKNIFDTIIRNLVSNSLKFTDKGGNITFKCETEESHITIKIIDNGVGIEPKKLEDILNDKIYYTTSGTRHELGTGLGLSLCKAFVGILNGKFNINSEPGKGTEFIISLPYVKKVETVVNPL